MRYEPQATLTFFFVVLGTSGDVLPQLIVALDLLNKSTIYSRIFFITSAQIIDTLLSDSRGTIKGSLKPFFTFAENTQNHPKIILVPLNEGLISRSEDSKLISVNGTRKLQQLCCEANSEHAVFVLNWFTLEVCHIVEWWIFNLKKAGGPADINWCVVGSSENLNLNEEACNLPHKDLICSSLQSRADHREYRHMVFTKDFTSDAITSGAAKSVCGSEFRVIPPSGVVSLISPFLVQNTIQTDERSSFPKIMTAPHKCSLTKSLHRNDRAPILEQYI
eukprot:Filipodium_phascolosomae@DN721_c0_g1_i2.p1